MIGNEGGVIDGKELNVKGIITIFHYYLHREFSFLLYEV